MSAMSDIERETSGRGASLVVWVVALAVLVFLVWARFAPLDEIVRGQGEVVSGARPQSVQNLEGGILAELAVGEGDMVSEGDVLARLHGTQFVTRVDDLRDQVIAAEIRRLRLEAELEGQFDFVVPEDYAIHSPDILASERALLAARQSDYTTRLEGARRLATETARELETLEDLFARDIVALLEVTEARKANSDAETKVSEIETTAELERATSYSETLLDLATLKQELRLAEDQLARTVVRAPMRGVVNAVGVTTIGGVVRPGEEMFEIIPAGDELFVEAQIAPKDIANVVAGQAATIKLTAYDYTVHGSLEGTVEMVSADTFKDERRPESEAHYRVTVALDTDAMTPRQAGISLRPGMQATVELHTGSKTVLDYLTKPLYRSREALREP
ncbi:putative protein secretion efflux system, membrane fusion protein (hemolysin-type secretion transmembrane protein) [Oceanicola granulosus HTCC2516]|uniref:AprE-like beta-barrel domain-containing protein n=1 Tax=Oceanicola granulosus (strain ATCC BAA-861 / DSM 15982 / KCTC 12143 / HTCC2516) TaxID=314256 RepID=Q2CIU9_OCEGH|nr:HlyD family efflux transporter periplasmic adaptor subunit [Oceanicola granulosus]EAR52490.1 putative protein secretion efflux system, membrane fusion protein (hemolysin-type secretion transmembrane protein) [Oceanicola granulosus HTCC2516]